MKIIKEGIRLEKDKYRLIQLRELLTEALEKMGLEQEDFEVMQGMDWYDEEGNATDWAYRIVMIVSEPASTPGPNLRLVRENKITKSQLRQIIKEEIEAEQSDTTPRGDS